ncbi:hypothetical protein [Nocardia lijiangensis]|uniref:hypothetical protein n=1 Tax=Nocardia lijiangensis TaxID=299618 RepID=UPI003D705CFB
MLIAGMPDEEVPAGQNGLFSSKAIIVGAAAAALFVGAITARAAVIIGGCLLFIVDFALLLAWDSMLHNQPATPGNDEPAHPSEIVLTVLVLWVVFPVLTMLLAIVWSAGRSKAGLIGQSPSRLEGMVANARLDQNLKAGSGVADAPRHHVEPPWW